MKTIEEVTLNDRPDHLSNDITRRKNDEDLFDDTITGAPKVADRKLPGWDNADEDGVTLKDDDIHGRDLDTDNGDEWDAEKMDGELDRRDLEDNDETNFAIHGVKNDPFGSLAKSIKNEAEPDPDEIPEQEEANQEDIDYPDDDRMEEAKDDEVSYHEPKGVEPPAPEHESETKKATLGDVDSTFTDDKHGRTTGRLGDHEPGSGINPPEHGAYNL